MPDGHPASQPAENTTDGRRRRRGRRIILLLSILVLLGLGDLYATITHSTTVGMIEINPIAAYLIGAGSITGLVLYKLGTLGVAAGLLLKARHRFAAEAAAWLLALVMVALTVHWYHYNRMMDATLTRAGGDAPILQRFQRIDQPLHRTDG